jgi:hypothetical protein
MWLIGVLVVATLIGQSVSYTDCIHVQKNAKQYRTLHESANDLHGTLARGLTRTRLISNCVNAFANENEHLISAGAAVALAIFTFYLWNATRGLRQYAGIQMQDMGQLLAAARDNAAAAASQADAMERLRLATEAQAEIARRTTLRPRIRVRNLNLDRPFEEGHPVEGQFWIVNIGGSVARVQTWRCHVMVGRMGSPPPWPIEPTTESNFDPHPILGTGVNTEIRFRAHHKLTRQEAQDLRGLSGNITLYIMGRIAYEDDLGVPRNTGFCRY